MAYKRKLLVISDWGPPMIDGPSIILGNLLREFDKKEILFFGRDQNTSIFNKEGNDLDIKKYLISVPSPYSPGLNELFRRIFRLLELIFIPISVLKGLFIYFLERFGCILATSDQPHLHFFTSAYLISRLTGIKLALYLLDPVEAFDMGRMQKYIAEIFVPRALKHASKIFVMSDALAEYYQGKYGVKCEVLPHSASLKENEPLSNAPEGINIGEEVQIVFSGKVSKYQEDALLNMRKAIELVPQRVKFKIFTSTPENYLKERGFSGDDIIIAHIDHNKLKEELKKADILFLPLSFNNSESIVVKAAFPAKTMDYLIANRPILIHAPKDSFLIKFAGENGFAACVAENDASKLAVAINDLIGSVEKRLELTRNCRKTITQYNSKVVYSRFKNILDEVLR